MDDIEVAQVIVKDDVAVPDREEGTGRRGIAGTVFVHKIAGAKAEQGASLAEVKAAAEKAVRNIRTMGVAMTPCILPAVGKPGFQSACEPPHHGCGAQFLHSAGSGAPHVQRWRKRDRDRHGNPW